MSEKFKLGITRNRLFEFENTVVFYGESETGFDMAEGLKALKMLFAKEPVLTGAVELEDDGEAYVVLNKVQAELVAAEGSKEEFFKAKRQQGIDFTQRLFEFYVLNGTTLVICGHTAVADAASLMLLAGDFFSFYSRQALSVESKGVNLLSDASTLPSNVFSPIVSRVAADLTIGWQKKTAVFGVSDYKNAREKYISQKSKANSVEITLEEGLLKGLVSYCSTNSLDVSSVVAFAFYESLVAVLGGKLKYKKLNIHANERLFFENEMTVGPYNGLVTVALMGKKAKNKTLQERAALFHSETYKRLTSSFSVFYNEILFLKLPPAMCDSAYMYASGEFRHKYSKKLAENYGCLNEVAGEFVSFNLTQKYWSKLNSFKNIFVSEPAKMRSSSLITFIRRNETSKIVFEYKENKISSSQAQAIVDGAVDILQKILKI